MICDEMVAEVITFKGHRILALKWTEDEQKAFQFGLKKAELILQEIESIKKFVKDGKELNKMNESWKNFEG